MDEQLLRQNLGQDIRIIAAKAIDSTNVEARRIIGSGERGQFVVAASEQSSGIGRMGRQFFSPRGGVYVTAALPSIEISNLPLVTPAAAVAARRAIRDVCGIECGIKWVNDLEVNEKKVCGILAEYHAGFVIVGVGVNLAPDADFPPELTGIAERMLVTTARGMSEKLASLIAKGVIDFASALPRCCFMDEYRAASTVIGREIDIISQSGGCRATALDIDAQGRLLVRDEFGNERALNSGEVSVRRARHGQEGRG